MGNNHLIVTFKILICFFLFNTYLNAQTYVLKVIPTGGPSKLALTEAAKKNKRGRHFKNRMIYVSNNEAYCTFVPYLANNTDSLKHKFPHVPSFTYLKEFDLFVEKLETSTKVHTKEDFVKKNGYHATNEFKNYHGKQVQKYISKNNFYEMYFWVTEASGDVPSNGFIAILKELGLLTLASNKEVVAVNYLSTEFPMDFMVLKDRSKKSLNSEVFEEENAVEEKGKPEKKYETVTNPDEIKHLLNKEYTFNFKRARVQTDFTFRSKKYEQTMYLSDENTNSLYFFEEKFYAFIQPYFIWGSVDENGDLIYIGSQKLVDDKEEKRILDLSDFTIMYMNTHTGIIDLCVQKKNDFWNFSRFKIAINTKEYANQKVDLILPNKKISNVFIKEEATFRASYNSMRRYEYATNEGEIQPLKTKKTYVIKK